MAVAEFRQAQDAMLRTHEVAAESRWVDTRDHGRVHVLMGGSGPPVLLLNGIGTPAAMLAPLMARLGGFTLYAVDLPGFGLTPGIPALCDDVRTNAAWFLADTLDTLGLEQVGIVANSLGSLWASWLAVDQPHRVSALVHVGCPAVALGTSAPLPMRLLSVPVLGSLLQAVQPPSPRQVEQLSRMVGEHPLPAEVAQLLLATERMPDCGQMLRSLLRRLVSLRGARPEHALTEEQLGEITQPVQLIWGDADPFGGVDVARRAAEVIPDAVLEIVPGGHAPWLREAEAVGEAAAAFLRRHVAVAPSGRA